VEISLNIETESLIEFSLLWFTLPFVNVHDVPLLVELSMSCVYNDVLVLTIDSSLDIKDLTVLDVSNECSITFPELPPS
jgi:hypothetical protein